MRCVSSSRLSTVRWCSAESEGRREALGELLARIKIAPQRIMRLDEASDRGRYLMIGAAEHGFVDTVRNLALDRESDLPVSGAGCPPSSGFSPHHQPRYTDP